MDTEKVAIVIAALAVVGLVVFSIVEFNNRRKAELLATFGEKKFTEEFLPNYILNLQTNSFSDLEVTPHYIYNYDDYNRSEKNLSINCELEFRSTEIDDYYTTEYDDSITFSLVRLMKNIRSNYSDASETFTLPHVGTVTVNIHKPEYDISVDAASGREYKIVYGYTESVYVEIDGDMVYYAQEPNADEIFGEVPYYGLSKEHLNHTELGFYDDVEYCIDYDALRPERRFATYIWYDSSGEEIFSADVLGDKVISTTDRRDGKFIVR